jgi:hypothetical protein
MAEVDPRLVPLPEDQPPQPRDIKLPPFWTSRPRAWFTYVESRFRLRGIDDDQQKVRIRIIRSGIRMKKVQILTGFRGAHFFYKLTAVKVIRCSDRTKLKLIL